MPFTCDAGLLRLEIESARDFSIAGGFLGIATSARVRTNCSSDRTRDAQLREFEADESRRSLVAHPACALSLSFSQTNGYFSIGWAIA